MLKFIYTVFGMAIFVGCASVDHSAPTHSWYSDEATTSEYRLDNYGCLNDSGSTENRFEKESEQFSEYKECMLSKGYALRTY